MRPRALVYDSRHLGCVHSKIDLVTKKSELCCFSFYCIFWVARGNLGETVMAIHVVISRIWLSTQWWTIVQGQEIRSVTVQKGFPPLDCVELATDWNIWFVGVTHCLVIGEVSFHSNESGYFADEDSDVEDDVSGQHVNLVWMWRKLWLCITSFATASVLSLGHWIPGGCITSNRKCTVKTAFFILHACVIVWVSEYSTAYTVCYFISCLWK